MARAGTFGIEEEYLLVRLDSGQVAATPSPAVIGRCCEVLGQYFAQEMFRSQIELASPVFTNLHEAREFFQHRRQRLSVALAEEGMGLYRHLLRNGTHADHQLHCLSQAMANGLNKAQALQAVVAAGACN